MTSAPRHLVMIFISLLFVFSPWVAVQAEQNQGRPDPLREHDVVAAATHFFDASSAEIAHVIQRIFAEHGTPNAYITAEETGGAFFGGLRYGKGELHFQNFPEHPVFWQSPSLGFDFGLNATRSFGLVYNLPDIDGLFQRFPGVSGGAFVIGGLGVTYYEIEGISIAIIRTGVGLRFGYNIGYLNFSRTFRRNPF